MDTINTVDAANLPHIKGRDVSRIPFWRAVFSWLLAWEIYPLVIIATFLRLYRFNATEFDADQAVIFHLARNAVTHGLIPVTTNIASIRILNPPATVYLLMSGAIFSANPVSGVIATALLNVLAVFLTYMLVRRYYGRFAASVAGFFYAGAQLTVFYSNFLWNQNLLAPFMPLFLLAIFWGVIERRRGWLAPAVVLWGWMIQLHGSAVLLIIPLGLACLLAFRTLRWRDVFLAVGLLLLIYSPYIVWEFVSHFSDVPILLKSIGEKSVIDAKAIHSYLDFLSPYPGGKPTNPLSWQYRFYPVMHWGYWGMLLLTTCAFGLALLALVKSDWRLLRFVPHGQKLPVASPLDATTVWGRLRSWYTEFAATPWRCGLLVLLAWQILPVILLLRHSLRIFDYYLLILMPGPFILIGIFSAQVVEWLGTLRFPWPLARFAFSLLLLALVFTLALGAVTRTLDRADGYNNPNYTYYTIADTQNALHEADSLAHVYHARHVYIALDVFTRDALAYLSGQMQTPHTTYESSNCMPLPGTAQGPALMLLGPADWAAESLVSHLPSARLVAQPGRPGGPPFHIYLVQPVTTSTGGISFLNNLALAANQVQAPAPGGAAPQLVTRWTVLRSALPADSTTYSYRLRASYQGKSAGAEATCTLSDLQPGEQLLATFNMPPGAETIASALPSLTATSWTTAPYDPAYGPFHLETFLQKSTPEAPLPSSNGQMSITLQG